MSERSARIAEIVNRIRLEALVGKDWQADSVATQYPDLHPELAQELQKLQVVLGSIKRIRFSEAARDAGSPLPVPGDRLGDYRIVRQIACGGMGVVYEAQHIDGGAAMALKVILAGSRATLCDILRFYQEAKAKALQHRNIVPIHTTGKHGATHFFVMDYVPGKNLRELSRGQPLSPRKAAEYLAKVAGAVAYAHGKGLLHRDIKPQNILIDEEDEPRLTDFGLAKWAEGDTELSRTGQMLGTCSYMSPEQARGAEVDERSDVYGLGSTLYAVLTGHPPFRGEREGEIIVQVLEKPAPALSLPTEDQGLVAIVRKCLEKQPALRYASAAELQDDLQRYLAGQEVEALQAAAQPPITDDAAVLLPRSTSNWASRIIVLAVLAVILLAVGWLAWNPITGRSSATVGPGDGALKPNQQADRKEDSATEQLASENEVKEIPPLTPSDAPFGDGTAWRLRDGGPVSLTDGAIVLSADEQPNYLITKREDFRNYHVRLYLSADAGTDAFLVLGAQVDRAGKWTGITSRIYDDGSAIRSGFSFQNFTAAEHGMRRATIAYEKPFKLDADFNQSICNIFVDDERRSGVAYTPPRIMYNRLGAVALLVNKGAVRVREIEINVWPNSVGPTTPAEELELGDDEASRAPKFVSGNWVVRDDAVEQTSKEQPALLIFGDRRWTDGDFTCDLWHGKEDVGISLLVRAIDSKHHTYAEFSGFGNTLVDLELVHPGGYQRIAAKQFQLPTEQWVPVHVELRGSKIRGFINGEEVLLAEDATRLTGSIGLRTWNGPARYRNIRFVDTAGQLLWEGYPAGLPSAK